MNKFGKQIKQAKFYLVFFLVTTFYFLGCDNNRVFEDYQQINAEGWQKDSLATFQFQVTDTQQTHNLYVNIRNELDYKYQNLWLFINIEQPGGTLACDTFNVLLATPSGKWMGEGFAGVKELQKEYRRNVFFPQAGEYKISLQHGMREELLKGIHDVGIRVEKSE